MRTSNLDTSLRMVEPTAASVSSERLMSLDALRGFAMLWIVGAQEIVFGFHKAEGTKLPIYLLVKQLSHSTWDGVTFYDLIFPLFIVVVGISITLSLTRRLGREQRSGIVWTIARRSIVLYFLGIVYYGGLAKGLSDVRLLGVLQRIALCYLVCGLIFCYVKHRYLIFISVAILLIYWAMMAFIPVPGIGAGNFQEEANLANYIDREFLPLKKWRGDYDPEGLLSTIPAIATCLFGVFFGLVINAQNFSKQSKSYLLLCLSVILIFLGLVWSIHFPLIKKIWTSSFALVAAGSSGLFLAIFYYLVEVWQVQKWAVPLVWVGANPIVIYLLNGLVDMRGLAERMVGGPVKSAFGVYGDLFIALVILLMNIVASRFLFRRRIFLRI